MHPFALINSVAAAVGLGKDVTQSVIDWSQRSRIRRRNSNAQKRFGLEVVAPSPNPDIDICFVHGLDGHWETTWTHRDEETGSDTFWPRDLLPTEPAIGCSLRVFSYGYDATVLTSEYLTTRTLYHHTSQLFEELCKFRTGSKERRRPIIFVGHELGGIVIQSAFILSLASGDERLRSICLSTTGVIFLGTPFRGMQDEEWLQSFVRIVRCSSAANRLSLPGLEHDSMTLKNMLQPFIAASSDIPIYGFQPKPSDKSHQMSECRSVKRYTVKPLPKNLADMGRITGRTDKSYKKMIDVIAELCEDAGRLSDESWAKYDDSEVAPVPPLQDIDNELLKIDPDLPARNPTFIDRNKELDQLDEKLLGTISSHSTVGSMLVVSGPTGIGKTQLVLEYAHTHQNHFTSIFWVFAESIRAIEMGFFSIAQKLLNRYARVIESSGVSDTEARTQAAQVLGLQELLNDVSEGNIRLDITVTRIVTRAVIEWFNRKENRQWLLILDGLDLEDIMEIFPLIPVNRCNHGHVILTRRQALMSNIIRHMLVSPLSIKSSRMLLTKLSGTPREKKDDDIAISKIIAACNGNPQRLVKVANQISSTGMAFGEYYKKFLQAREMKSNLKDTKIPFEVPHSVNEDWEYRVQQLTRPEKKLLNCCCVFPGEPIPWGIFSVQPNTFGATNVNGLEEAMMKLVSRNLISCNENYQYVIANELIAEWHLGRLDQKEKVAAAKRAWQCIASFAKNTSTKAGDGLSSSLTQKEAVSLVADSSASTREDLSWFQLSAQNWVDLAELCRRRGHYTAADKFGDCAYRKLQDGNPSKKTMLRLLGIYLEMKATLKAETLWGTIASLRTAVPRKDLKEYEAQNLLEIRLKYQCGNIDEAIDLAKHYIIHLEDREGPVDALTLSTLKVLASFLIEKGNYEMADPIMHRLLLSYESIYGPNDPITTEALERLGFLFVAQGKFDDAEKSYARAKRQNEQRLGLDHPTTQVCAAKLAAVYNRQGRHNESLELYRSALESMQDWFGPQHPDVIKIRISRAEVYMAQREFELAAKDYSNVLIASESMDESIAMLLSSLKIESATVATQLHFALTEAGQLAEARGIAEKYHIQPET